ncbi:LysR family transcriptional regulator [Variovorax sp. VNK109]|jgi:LysR family carnitine catabolism transcriptional activator|uniref:LysR family transcriptional regulator n=1 Tax=Variovorax sp. VNK109 TaxID=3400919 RepID=UPI003C0F5E38
MRGLPSVRQLRAFVAVYHTGQVSAAAGQLSITQPAVTVLLRDLEDRLGVKLFDRTTRSLARTAAAEQALAYAERALAELEGMGAALRGLATGEQGVLRIAATSTTAQTLLPRALRHFGERYPGVRVVVDDCAPLDFVERITRQRVDLGVGILETGMPGLRERVFLRDWLVAAGRGSASFQAGGSMTWKQLAAHDLIVVRAGYGVRRRVEQAAAQAGAELRIVHEATLLTTALAMAAEGLGVAVVPGAAAAYSMLPGLVSRKLVRPAVARPMSVISLADRAPSGAAKAFEQFMVEHFGPA